MTTGVTPGWGLASRGIIALRGAPVPGILAGAIRECLFADRFNRNAERDFIADVWHVFA